MKIRFSDDKGQNYFQSKLPKSALNSKINVSGVRGKKEGRRMREIVESDEMAIVLKKIYVPGNLSTLSQGLCV